MRQQGPDCSVDLVLMSSANISGSAQLYFGKQLIRQFDALYVDYDKGSLHFEGGIIEELP